jgi:hypothetical protein
VPGVVVIHQFNLASGEFTTRKYKDPKHGVRRQDGSRNESVALRSP